MALSEPQACIASAIMIGTLTEIIARALNFWRYQNPVMPILNVLILFGVVMGGLIAALIGHGQSVVAIGPLVITCGALVGLAYEAANHFYLRAWRFPQNSLAFLGTDIDKAAIIGAAWGLVPFSALLLARALQTLGTFPHAG